MDEPFGAVDPIVRAQLQREFAKLQRDLGKTVVFVTHDVDEAIVLGDRIAVLETGGRLAQLASPAELLANPVSPFVSDFLGGRTVEYEDGVAVGYRIESRFEAGEPDPDAAVLEDVPHGQDTA
jgi:osmoprotectant transport system ATP-binding protein